MSVGIDILALLFTQRGKVKQSKLLTLLFFSVSSSIFCSICLPKTIVRYHKEFMPHKLIDLMSNVYLRLKIQFDFKTYSVLKSSFLAFFI